MSPLLWLIPALALLPCGWFAAAWHYQRKIMVLQAQVHAVRQTATEHANQARWQIGQLQADLAARPPLQEAERDRRASAAEAVAAATASRGAASRQGVDHDFPPTLIMSHRPAAAMPAADRDFPATSMLPNGFADTQVMK